MILYYTRIQKDYLKKHRFYKLQIQILLTIISLNFLKVDTQAIFIPEEDRWISILELNENDKFLEFYHSMLQLYEAVCAQSNNYVAHQVCKLIDERQLMYCIQNQCNNNKTDTIFFIK